MLNLAINGFGRIGRCFLRALQERQFAGASLVSGANVSLADMQVIAINELADASTLAYLTKYDSTHGRFPANVELALDDNEHECLMINDHQIALYHQELPDQLPWHDIDILIECSGSFSDRFTAERHLKAGAKRLLFSQPAQSDVDVTLVYGVNQHLLNDRQQIVSAASCTTNAVVPIIKLLDRELGIEMGTIRTIHSTMNDQPVIDAYHHTDLRKTRAAFESMIPVNTALAAGIERILPSMQGKFTASAVRVPVSNVSAIDLTLLVKQQTTEVMLNQILKTASLSEYAGVIGYCEEPLVSCDYVHDPHSGVIDASQISVTGGRLIKLWIWFDNEWGYANRMLDIVSDWAKKIEKN